MCKCAVWIPQKLHLSTPFGAMNRKFYFAQDGYISGIKGELMHRFSEIVDIDMSECGCEYGSITYTQCKENEKTLHKYKVTICCNDGKSLVYLYAKWPHEDFPLHSISCDSP